MAPTAGPSLPIGPSFPPPPAPKSTVLPAVESDSDDDDFGPSLPPDMIASRAIAGPSKPVQGPTLPPSFNMQPPAPKKRETPLSSTYSDDEDDSFGPMPLAAGYREAENEGVRLFREREEREEEKRRKEKEGKGKMKREEWMMLPPEDKDLATILAADTTKLKSRTFSQTAKAASSKSTGPNLWTETPAERQQRMQDELSGKKGKAEISAAGGGRAAEEDDEQRRKRERDWVLRDEVERHNKSARSSSLFDAHSRKKPTAKDKEDGPPGIWDRDRDMSVGGRLMDDSKRADMVKSAKELGGRFGSGSYL